MLFCEVASFVICTETDEYSRIKLARSDWNHTYRINRERHHKQVQQHVGHGHALNRRVRPGAVLELRAVPRRAKVGAALEDGHELEHERPHGDHRQGDEDDLAEGRILAVDAEEAPVEEQRAGLGDAEAENGETVDGNGRLVCVRTLRRRCRVVCSCWGNGEMRTCATAFVMREGTSGMSTIFGYPSP